MTPYNYHWRYVILPWLRVRAANECERCAMPERPMGLYRLLEGAHLDGNSGNNDFDNLALLCRRCHRAHDYDEWAAKFQTWLQRVHDERLAAKDAGRPILAMLREAS